MAFKDDIKLSIFALDKNALSQPELYDEWSGKWASAVSNRDKLKEQISVRKAEIDKEIRKDSKKYGWDQEGKSPTENWINQTLTLNPELKILNDQLNEAQYQVNLCSSAKETIEQRGKMLNILTTLYQGNYFVAKSRADHNYSETLTKSNTEAQEQNLKDNQRMVARRRTK